MALGDWWLYRQVSNPAFYRAAVEISPNLTNDADSTTRDLLVLTDKVTGGLALKRAIPGPNPPVNGSYFAAWSEHNGPQWMGRAVYGYNVSNPGFAFGARIIKATVGASGDAVLAQWNVTGSSPSQAVPIVAYGEANGYGVWYNNSPTDPALPNIGQQVTYINPIKETVNVAFVVAKQRSLITNCPCRLVVVESTGLIIRDNVPFSRSANNPATSFYTY